MFTYGCSINIKHYVDKHSLGHGYCTHLQCDVLAEVYIPGYRQVV